MADTPQSQWIFVCAKKLNRIIRRLIGIVAIVRPWLVIQSGTFGTIQSINLLSHGPRMDWPFFLSPANVSSVIRAYISRNRLILSSAGGCVEKSEENVLPLMGLEINKCAVADEAVWRGVFEVLIFSKARARPSG